MSSAALEAALEYAGYGWAVYPVNGKVPFKGTHGYKDAAKDQSRIRELWATRANTIRKQLGGLRKVREWPKSDPNT